MPTLQPDTLLVLAGSASFPESLSEDLQQAGWSIRQTEDWPTARQWLAQATIAAIVVELAQLQAHAPQLAAALHAA
ncbi:VpsR-related response regulator, partial [Trichothermofontia sp.]